MLLRCRIPLSSFVLDVDLAFDSRVAAILGPSGAGKTTLLEAVAGLRPIESGEIEIGGRTLFSSARGIDVPARERAVGYVPQDPALFPHLSVRKNILFGVRNAVSRNGSPEFPLEHVVALLEIRHLLERSVHHISGGEAQRVALARALLSRPRLLLLDEPLASLDIGLKERILPYLKRVRDELAVPMIYVTHDTFEALSLADWMIMLTQGRVVAQGVPYTVLTSGAVLSQIDPGLENVFEAVLIDSSADEGRSRVRLQAGTDLFIPYTQKPPNSRLQIGIAGDDILVATQKTDHISAGNILQGTIQGLEIVAGQAILRVAAKDEFYVRLTPTAVRRLALSVGDSVFLIIKTRSCVILGG
ncbi:MAG TPA: molybdenum ABC transporter ATP-binding protein [Candidatus Binatia bacterium]|jgi:molybdate transport system ATP-binding protein